MKKMLLAFIILSFFLAGAVHADTSGGQVCGNVYQFAYGEMYYTLRFDGLNPCAVGVAKLKYADQSKSLVFTVDDGTRIIDVEQIGHMVLDGDRIVMLDSASIILDIYPFSPTPSWVKH